MEVLCSSLNAKFIENLIDFECQCIEISEQWWYSTIVDIFPDFESDRLGSSLRDAVDHRMKQNRALIPQG